MTDLLAEMIDRLERLPEPIDRTDLERLHRAVIDLLADAAPPHHRVQLRLYAAATTRLLEDLQ